jgi:hypothetical protein
MPLTEGPSPPGDQCPSWTHHADVRGGAPRAQQADWRLGADWHLSVCAWDLGQIDGNAFVRMQATGGAPLGFPAMQPRHVPAPHAAPPLSCLRRLCSMPGLDGVAHVPSVACMRVGHSSATKHASQVRRGVDSLRAPPGREDPAAGARAGAPAAGAAPGPMTPPGAGAGGAPAAASAGAEPHAAEAAGAPGDGAARPPLHAASRSARTAHSGLKERGVRVRVAWCPGAYRVCLNNRVWCGVVGLQVCSCAPRYAGARMYVCRCRLSPERCASALAGSAGAPGRAGAGAPGQQGAAGAGSQAGGSGGARDAAGGEGAAGAGPDSKAGGAGERASGGDSGGDARGPGFVARVRAFAEVVRHEVRPACIPPLAASPALCRAPGRDTMRCEHRILAGPLRYIAVAAHKDLVNALGRARKQGAGRAAQAEAAGMVLVRWRHKQAPARRAGGGGGAAAEAHGVGHACAAGGRAAAGRRAAGRQRDCGRAAAREPLAEAVAGHALPGAAPRARGGCGPSGRGASLQGLTSGRPGRAIAIIIVPARCCVGPVSPGGLAVLRSRLVWTCASRSSRRGACQLLWPPARPTLPAKLADRPSARRAQLGAHPLFRRLAALGEHRVFARGKEVADDLRERWETSDSPLVQRIQARRRLCLVTHLWVRVQGIGFMPCLAPWRRRSPAPHPRSRMPRRRRMPGCLHMRCCRSLPCLHPRPHAGWSCSAPCASVAPHAAAPDAGGPAPARRTRATRCSRRRRWARRCARSARATPCSTWLPSCACSGARAPPQRRMPRRPPHTARALRCARRLHRLQEHVQLHARFSIRPGHETSCSVGVHGMEDLGGCWRACAAARSRGLLRMEL